MFQQTGTDRLTKRLTTGDVSRCSIFDSISYHALGPDPLGVWVLFFRAHFFGVADAQISKLWHQVVTIYSCYATSLVAIRIVFVGPFMLVFVGYGHKSEICGNM